MSEATHDDKPVVAPFEFADEARHAVTGGLHADTLTRKMYATDASIYEIEPMGAAFPRTKHEVAALHRLAHAHRTPIIPRGGGSGLAGEALGRAVVYDTTNHLNNLLEISPEDGWVRAECGMVLDVLNRALAPFGKKLGPDPASGSRCVVGGVVANNSAGAHSLYYSHFRKHILELECVLANGEMATFKPIRLDSEEYNEIVSRDTLEARIYRETRRLCEQHADLIRGKWPHHLNRHRSGYLMHGVVEDGVIDLTKLVCGSEGTLAAVVEAKLRIVDIPAARGLVLLHYPSTVAAGHAVASVLPQKPYALELLDQNVVAMARAAKMGYEKYLQPDTGAVLMAEFEGQDMATVEEQARRCARECAAPNGPASRADLALDDETIKAFWAIRKSAEPLVYGKHEHLHPVGFIEDTSMDPSRLGEYLEGKERIFAKHGIEYATYGHAGAGVLHTRPYLDLTIPEHCEKMEQIAVETYELLLRLGGSISGEHGDGLSRTQFLEMQFGPELYRVFHEVKDVWDPHHILNPGKIVYNTDPHLVRSNLRHGPGYRHDGMARRALVWKPGELEREAERCNGCAECRAVETIVTMCPIFKATGDEAASPRAKGNLMRLLMNGRLDPEWAATDEFKRVADLCVNCKACFLECPSHVNIPVMMMEAKAQWVAENGQTIPNLFFVHAELVSKLNCMIAPLANWAARNPILRWAMERMIGVDRRRTLPEFSSRTFLRNSDEHYRPAQSNGRKVVYFVDLFANYNDPQLAEAFVKVMNHNGVEVAVPRDQSGCGMPAMDYGSVEPARRTIRHNARALKPWIEKGYTVVTSEPTATLSLKDEYLYFVDDEDTRALAAATRDAMDYLREMEREGVLRKDFKREVPVRFGYHAPCHLKALHVGKPGVDLARLVPGVSIREINRGCCGIAGTYGMKKSGYDNSMAAGSGMIEELRLPEVQLGMSECSTCKIQMEHGSEKPTIHPLKILAHAYGLIDVAELMPSG
jgi:FAD/FMN-containing dehydrogenase/Fe-S oxidoreductase